MDFCMKNDQVVPILSTIYCLDRHLQTVFYPLCDKCIMMIHPCLQVDGRWHRA